jgi:hypothetical protein
VSDHRTIRAKVTLQGREAKAVRKMHRHTGSRHVATVRHGRGEPAARPRRRPHHPLGEADYGLDLDRDELRLLTPGDSLVSTGLRFQLRRSPLGAGHCQSDCPVLPLPRTSQTTAGRAGRRGHGAADGRPSAGVPGRHRAGRGRRRRRGSLRRRASPGGGVAVIPKQADRLKAQV